MISSNLQSEADLHDSESLSDASSSICSNGATPVNKMRSIKLVKLPSVRRRRRPATIRSDRLSLLSSDGDCSSQSNRVKLSDASPHYMKTTSSSTAKDNLKRSSLSRLPSTKFRRSLMRKSKSIKLRNRSAVLFKDAAESPDHLKAVDSADAKAQFQASTNAPKSGLRMLKKMPSLRTNRSSMKRSIHRATCSSTLKDSKFPNHLEFQAGGSELEGASTMKVCPYTYCSLHGHRHSTAPPLKRFVSMRRRAMKSQRSRNLGRQPSIRVKRSSNLKKVISGRKTWTYNDVEILETASVNTNAELDTHMIENDGIHVNEDNELALSLGDSESITWEEKSTICEKLERESAASEENSQDHFGNTDSESSRVGDKREMEKKKHMGLWSLIYKHMASGIAAEDEERKPAAETHKEEGENADNNLEKDSQIQLHQQNAVKLVKEAFDKILSEIPDQSPNDQSSDSGKNHEEDEFSIPTSKNDGEAQEAVRITPKEDETNGEEAKKTPSKSKQQMPSNWSNLKKLIMFNRFVKAMDKVRKLNPRKPRVLPVPLDPVAEKVHLRHQTTEEKKNSEEWMLDYALRQVISTLAPAQKQKVALLVQAFESVSPVPGHGANISSNFDSSLHVSPQKSSMKAEETNFGVSLRKTAFPEKRSDGNLQHIKDLSSEDKQDTDSYSEIKQLNLDSSCNSASLNSLNTDASLQEKFGAFYVDNDDHNSILKDDQLDSLSFKPKEDGEDNGTEKPSAELADLANREVSASKVHEHDLGVNGQHEDGNSSNHALQNVEVSASGLSLNCSNTSSDANEEVSMSKVCDLGSGIGDQPDAENTSNDVQGNRELCACEVHGLHLGFNAHSDISSSKMQVLDLWSCNHQHYTANTSDKIPAKEQSSASDACDIGSGFNDQYDVANSSNHILASQVRDLDLGLNDQLIRSDHQTNGGNEKSDDPENEDVNSIDSIPKPVEKSSEVKQGEVDSNNKFLKLITRNEESNASSADLVNEKQKNMGLWYLIYKHMASGTTTTLYESGDKAHETNNTEQNEAIRMVEEAIDEIPLPDSQDDSPNDKPCLDSEDTDTANGEPNATEVGNKTEEKPKKSWSNLKKMILLKRFVKAMEKVKKFNPREPRFLPVENEKEAEKVQLRHQDTEDRKNADEWMLDYTLQQVVAKLTPARKRKVQLLVEAFETVIPTIES